ncbi:MAG TPA: hypothetical protein VFX88_03425 [Actinomycetota bacterium]|nr:hypothetical protein [Actinomycetota bacterium]
MVDPLRFTRLPRPGRALAELLAFAPPEVSLQVRAELAAAGLDPDATGWPRC